MSDIWDCSVKNSKGRRVYNVQDFAWGEKLYVGHVLVGQFVGECPISGRAVLSNSDCNYISYHPHQLSPTRLGDYD